MFRTGVMVPVGWKTEAVPDRWRIEERTEPASVLHASWPSVERDHRTPAVAVCTPTGPAVVLGSTQDSGVVDAGAAEAAGLAVVRRRSGGGAVLVTPDDPVWIDVWVPVDHDRWSVDVTHAFEWLGANWAAVIGDVGLSDVEVEGPGPGECTRWSSLVCFGGVGAGEVTVGGRKVVGLSQRRNRFGAWFHGACVLHWDPTPLLDVLSLPDAERSAARQGLAGAVIGLADATEVAGIDPSPTGAVVIAAFLDLLS
jgi:lipoate-protein ligase A